MDDAAGLPQAPETSENAGGDPAGDPWLGLAAILGHRCRGVGDVLRDSCPYPAPTDTAPARLLAGDAALLAELPGSTAARLPSGAAEARRAAARLHAALEGCAARLLSLYDPAYPPALREVPDPPPWLFCRGDPGALSMPMVAIVGSRRASHAGRRLAEILAARLAGAGYCVVSGMALGIDGAAHEGALGDGLTAAVLGTGIDECYPPRHRGLASRIVEAGCIVSELPPGTPPHRGQFPRRNRIISGMAEATVIVEAALPSGSMHTAAAALEQGREVFVFPWSVLHDGGAGCLTLLRDGATPLTSLDELEEHFPLLAQEGQNPRDGPERALLDLIGDGAPTAEALQAGSGMPAAELFAVLARLEVQGRVLRRDGGYVLAHCKPCQPGGSC